MKLNSSQLEAFFCVAKTLNFTKAAEVLHVTQSALSQRIAKLEEELETTLFIRERSSIRLTEEGQKVLRFCQFNQSAESDLLLDLKGNQNELGGVLRIAGFSSVNRSLVIPALRKIMTTNSNLSIQLITKEIRDLDDLLQSAEVDYIISDAQSASSEIESIFLGYEDNVLVVSKKYPESEIYLDHDENDPVTKKYFLQKKIKFKPTKMRYLDDVYGLIDGIRNGYGKAVIPRHLIEDFRDLEIVNSQKFLRIPVYLQFFKQPYFKKVHNQVVLDLTSYFSSVLQQEKK